MAAISAVEEARALARPAGQATRMAVETFTATLDDKQLRLFNAYSDARTHQRAAEEDLHEAILLAHAGGLAPMLRAVLAHVRSAAPCSCREAS